MDPAGRLLIRGQAGSGKTTVLAARAGWIRSTLGSGSMLFLVYNRALAGYVTRLLRAHDCLSGVRVRHFHAWARETARALRMGVHRWTQGEERDEMLGAALRARIARGHHRLLGVPASFWGAEFEWIAGRGVETREQYREVPRIGRGNSIQVRGREERDVVWDVYEGFVQRVRQDGGWDIQDPAGLVRAAVEQAPGRVLPEKRRYDHVFIDEVQDFDLSWLRVVAPVARVSLSMAGDLAQRIYRREFTWRQAGIELPSSRSRVLGSSLRTTRQIMSAAIHLATNPDLRADQDYHPPTIPDREGPRVRRFLRQDRASLVAAVAEDIATHMRAEPNLSFVVMVPRQAQCYALLRALTEIPSVATRAAVVTWGNIRQERGEVELTTLHSGKGLEWDHVWLFGIDDEVIPGSFVRSSDPDDREDELNRARRLVYMAMTRARRSLTVAATGRICRFFDPIPAGIVVNL